MSLTDLFNFLHSVYTGLPWIAQEALYIVFIYGLVRRYIGKDIETEVDKRGWFRDGLIHTAVRHTKGVVARHKQMYQQALANARQADIGL